MAPGPEETATGVAQEWAAAIKSGDVDTQVKLLPKTMFVKPEDRDRERKLRLHEKEMALIRGEKYLSFDLQPAKPPVVMGNTTIVVIPYRSLVIFGDGKLQSDSSLVALGDKESNWSVFDGTGHTPRSLRKIVPGYQGNLALPRATTKLLKDE